MPELPGFDISALRERTSARPNEPLTISGRVSVLGIGVPAAVRVFLEGPSYNPEVRTFDTFSSPGGDYSVAVMAEKGGQYQVYAQAFPPLPPLPVPGAPQPLLPPFAESPKPPLVIGNPVEGGVQFETAPGVPQTLPAPPQTPIEIAVPITITVPGAPGAPTPALPPFFFPGFPTPEAPAAPAPAERPAGVVIGEAPRGLTPGQLALATPSASPRSIGPGQTVAMAIPFLNLAQFSSTVDSRLQVLGANGAPVATLPGLVFRPAPGSWSTQRTSWTAPRDASPGSYGLRVQAWDPQTFNPSDPSTYLVSQDFPDLFAVAAPALPAPVAPAAPKGLVPEELNLLSPSASPTSLAPGQTVTFTIPFMNTGPIGPTILADTYVMGPTGAVAALPRLSLAPQPNVPASRQVQWTVPSTAAPGSYGLQVFAWDPNTFVAGDPSTYLVREEIPNLFTVQAAPAPAVPALPAPGAPAAPKGLLPGQLSLVSPSASPAVLNPGQTVTLTIPFLNTGPIAPPIQADSYVMGPSGATVAQLPRMSFAPQPDVQASRQVQWTVPAAAEPGQYSLQVFAWDPNTFVAGDPSTYLVREEIPNLFTVQAAPAPAPALPAPTPTALQVGQLTLGTPTASPSSALPGQTVSITLPFSNSGLASPTILTAMFTENHDLSSVGRGVRYPLAQLSFEPTPGAVTSRTVTWLAPADAAPGGYDVGVIAWDPLNPDVALVFQRYNNVFTVQAAGLVPGDLYDAGVLPLQAPVYTGETQTFQVSFWNNKADAQVQARYFVLDPDGNAVAMASYDDSFLATRTGPAKREFRWPVPAGQREGYYGVQLFVWDPRTFVPGDTSTYLIARTLDRLFAVQRSPYPVS